MAVPENPEDFVRLQAKDVSIYVSLEVWKALKPKQSKFLVGVAGYGRFWVHLEGIIEDRHE